MSPEDEDLYLAARQSLIADVDPSEVADEEAVAKRELALAKKGKLPNISTNVVDSDSELSEASLAGEESDTDNDHGRQAVAQTAGRSSKQKRTQAVVDQVSWIFGRYCSPLNHFQLHAIVVDVLRSEPRRQKMRSIIRSVCSEPYQGLTLVRGMPIRWNSTLAEIQRALLLQSVSHSFVFQRCCDERGVV